MRIAKGKSLTMSGNACALGIADSLLMIVLLLIIETRRKKSRTIMITSMSTMERIECFTTRSFPTCCSVCIRIT